VNNFVVLHQNLKLFFGVVIQKIKDPYRHLSAGVRVFLKALMLTKIKPHYDYFERIFGSILTRKKKLTFIMRSRNFGKCV